MKTLKKILIITLITTIFLIYSKTLSLAETATIITETLRLRKEPTTDSSILELISEDEKVEVLESGLGDDSGWYKVIYKGITGYVYGEYIKIDNTNTENNKPTINENTNTEPEENNENTNTEPKNNEEPQNNEPQNNTTENNEENNNENTENGEENNTETPENNEPEQENENTEQPILPNIQINSDMKVKENTDVYIIPLINAEKIGNIEQEGNIHIIQVVNGWAYISLENNTYGWIRCSKIA